MPEPEDRAALSAENLHTWAAVATILEWLPRALDAQLQRDADLTHFEYGVLYALADAPEATLRMSTLAGYSNSSLSRLSRAVARLEAKGWVQRRVDSDDGRYTLATLTELGRDRVELASPGHVETVNRLVFDALTKSQARQLGEISRRIMTAIRSDDGWTPSALS